LVKNGANIITIAVLILAQCFPLRIVLWQRLSLALDWQENDAEEQPATGGDLIQALDAARFCDRPLSHPSRQQRNFDAIAPNRRNCAETVDANPPGPSCA
jgi:hypothetical protein